MSKSEFSIKIIKDEEYWQFAKLVYKTEINLIEIELESPDGSGVNWLALAPTKWVWNKNPEEKVSIDDGARIKEKILSWADNSGYTLNFEEGMYLEEIEENYKKIGWQAEKRAENRIAFRPPDKEHPHP